MIDTPRIALAVFRGHDRTPHICIFAEWSVRSARLVVPIYSVPIHPSHVGCRVTAHYGDKSCTVEPPPQLSAMASAIHVAERLASEWNLPYEGVVARLTSL